MAKKKTDEATTEPAAEPTVEQAEDFTCPNCGYNPKRQTELIAERLRETDTDAEPA